MDAIAETVDSRPPLRETDGERVADDGGLIVHSRRTERLRKKQQKKLGRSPPEPRTLSRLPYELIISILYLLRPSDLFRLSRTCETLNGFIRQEQEVLAKGVIACRYPCLEKCLRLPVRLGDVDPSLHDALQAVERQDVLALHRKPYQHIRPPDASATCTCLTCLLRWNSLCLAVDFAHWQPHLDAGEPIPIIPRGSVPAWNQRLTSSNAGIVDRALHSPLWYACILEAHLASTVRSIRRHTQNKGNRRRRFRMTTADEAAGTDAFLERSGPPTIDFPFHRDNYYMLESYLPNRSWNAEEERWMYMPAEQHDRDVQFVKAWLMRRRAAAAPPDAEPGSAATAAQ